MVDEEQQSMTSASTTDYTVSAPSNKGSSSSKQQNNTLNAIKTAVSFGSTTKDTSSGTKEGESGRQVKMSSPQNRKLSMVSRMYDIDGDGQLDEAELAMRNLDRSNRGHLTNDSVYKLMQEQMAQQRQLFKFKKIMIGLSVVVFLLTLSNLGTSFAAAYLAKDTSVNDKDVLVNSHTKKALSTQTTSAQYGAERDLEVQDVEERDPKIAFQTFVANKGGEGESGGEPWEGGEQDSSGRRLACEEIEVWNDDTGEYDTELECAGSPGGEGLVIDERVRGASGSCSNIADQCNQRNNVDIYRRFSNGSRVTINICGPSTEVTEVPKKGRYTFKARGLTKVIMQMTDFGCKFDGADLSQQAGEVCDTGSDCTRGHKCYQMPANRVSSCKNDCSSAFKGGSSASKISFNECASDCEGNTCELVNNQLVLAGTTPEPSRSPSAKPTTGRPTISPAPSLSPSLSSAPSTTSSPTKPCDGPCPKEFPNGCTQNGCNNAEGNVNIEKNSSFMMTKGPDKGRVYFTSKGNNFKYIGTCEETAEGTCFVPE